MDRRAVSLKSQSSALIMRLRKQRRSFVSCANRTDPKAARPVAKGGRAAGSGVVDANSNGTPAVSDSVYAIAGPGGGEI
jgi:hypothetical protein